MLTERYPQTRDGLYRWGSLIVLVSTLLATQLQAGQLQPFQPDTQYPDFDLIDLNGKRHSLSGYSGEVVLVSFWASWCPPCILEMPSMQRLKQRLSGKPFRILSINLGEKKRTIQHFLRMVDYRQTVLLDEEKQTFHSWQGEVLPTSYLVDKQGEIRYRLIGEMEWDSEDTLAIVEKLMAESTEPTDAKESGRVK